AYILLFLGREHRAHAVNGRDTVNRVQRAEHQVACFSGGDGRAHGFQVAHFADHDDVRVLAQGEVQGLGKRVYVRVQLALVDQAALVAVHELNRVFDRDDVVVKVLVD